MKLISGPKIQCKNCRHIFTVDAKDFEEQPTHEYKRELEDDMGPHVRHSFEASIYCPSCNLEISLFVIADVYPSDLEEKPHTNCKGGTVIEEAQVEL